MKRIKVDGMPVYSIAVHPEQSWYIAEVEALGMRAAGSTRTEAIAHLLMDGRKTLTGVEISVAQRGDEIHTPPR